MRTLIAGAAVAVLALGTVAADHEPRPPVDHVYHLHGDYPAGELDYPAEGLDGIERMDSTAPTESTPRSSGATNYVAGPNPTCSGNGLLATWAGNVDGDVVGDLTVDVPVVSTGASVVVEVFPDGTGACNEAYQEPALREVVEVPPGESRLTVTFPDVGFSAVNVMTLQLRVLMDVHVSVEDEETGTAASRTSSKPNEQVRFLYDSVDHDGTVTFSCVPTLDSDETCEWG